MEPHFSNAPTQRMYQKIAATCPTQLKSEAQEARLGYVGLEGIAAEIKSQYSNEFADDFSEPELKQVQWLEIVTALAKQ